MNRQDDGRICFKDCGEENCICKNRIKPISNELKESIDLEVEVQKLKREHLDEITKYIFKDTPVEQERKIVAWTGCYTYGSINIDDYCEDLNCDNCMRRKKEFSRLIQEEVDRQVRTFYDSATHPLTPDECFETTLMEVQVGSLILTPNDTDIECRIKFNQWLDERDN